jgi:hypothetical protein
MIVAPADLMRATRERSWDCWSGSASVQKEFQGMPNVAFLSAVLLLRNWK